MTQLEIVELIAVVLLAVYNVIQWFDRARLEAAQNGKCPHCGVRFE